MLIFGIRSRFDGKLILAFASIDTLHDDLLLLLLLLILFSFLILWWLFFKILLSQYIVNLLIMLFAIASIIQIFQVTSVHISFG